MQVRQIAVQDLPHVLAFAEKVGVWGDLVGEFDRDYFNKIWSQAIPMEQGAIFGLFSPYNKLKGIAAGFLATDWRTGELYLHQMSWKVAEDSRGDNNGSKLLESLEEWGKTKGAKRFVVSHYDNDIGKAAKSYFKKRGFKQLAVQLIKEI